MFILFLYYCSKWPFLLKNYSILSIYYNIYQHMYIQSTFQGQERWQQTDQPLPPYFHKFHKKGTPFCYQLSSKQLFLTQNMYNKVVNCTSIPGKRPLQEYKKQMKDKIRQFEVYNICILSLHVFETLNMTIFKFKISGDLQQIVKHLQQFAIQSKIQISDQLQMVKLANQQSHPYQRSKVHWQKQDKANLYFKQIIPSEKYSTYRFKVSKNIFSIHFKQAIKLFKLDREKIASIKTEKDYLKAFKQYMQQFMKQVLVKGEIYSVLVEQTSCSKVFCFFFSSESVCQQLRAILDNKQK